MFVRVRLGEVTQLLQKEGVLKDPLDRFDQVRLKGRRVLLLGITGMEEGLQGIVSH